MRSNEELYSELFRLAKRANQRILRLEREFGKDSFAIKNLRNRLSSPVVSAWTESGRIRYNKSMTDSQMRATIKATKDFLASMQSKVSGARKIREYRRKQIAQAFEVEDVDVDKFFDILEDRKSSILDKLDPSLFFTLVKEARDINATYDKWVELLEQYILIGNDVDLRQDALDLYNKYVIS